MSFGQRAGGGPGGLSINTGTANSSLYVVPYEPAPRAFEYLANTVGSSASQTSQPQPSGGLFGASTTSQPAQGGLFGSANQQQQTGGSGGLFGSSQPQSNQQQGSGGLFGKPAQTQPAQGGGLFGSRPIGGGGGGGLFGSNQQQQQTQPQQTGGLFGSSTQQAQPQQTGGLFGSTQQQSQPQQPGGLFGSSMQQQQQQPQQQTGSMFGSQLGQNQNQQQQQQQQQQQPQQQQSMFGGSSNPLGGLFNNTQPQQQGTSLFGGSSSINPLTLGQSQTSNPAAQTIVPGVKIDVSNLRSTTRFTDLHEDLQRELERCDEFIRSQMRFAEACQAREAATRERVSQVPIDVAFMLRLIETVNQAHENDAAAIAYVRTTVEQDAEDARLSFRALDNLRLPEDYHVRGLFTSVSLLRDEPKNITDPKPHPDKSSSPPRDIVDYYSARADTLAATLASYSDNTAAIETHLRGVEARTAQQMQQLQLSRGGENGVGDGSAEAQVRQLASVLREFENGILAVASKVGGAREGVQSLELGGVGRRDGRRAGGGGTGGGRRY
ncbi:MAG: hypothetical protein M1833_001037 [Piccolia ochrophora]|nr:MAG: hypothetical protein M1833_001037 [Piccolia ochrophora]